MKLPFFSGLKRNKAKAIPQEPSVGDRHQERIHSANLSKFNERIAGHVKKFARNHRTTVTEDHLSMVYDAAKSMTPEKISHFLSGRERKELHISFQGNGVCLRRNNAFFVLTSITCFPSGQARITYHIKDQQYRPIEREETV